MITSIHPMLAAACTNTDPNIAVTTLVSQTKATLQCGLLHVPNTVHS